MARSPEQQVAGDESALTALLEVLCDAVLDEEHEFREALRRRGVVHQDRDRPGCDPYSLNNDHHHPRTNSKGASSK